MKHLTTTVIAAACFLVIIFTSSCGNKSRDSVVNRYETNKYKGYKIVKQIDSDWNNLDRYVIKNDSFVLDIYVPTIFSDIYSVGDTIK